MTRDELNAYWRYYLLLEKRFVKATSFVELCDDNYSTYSIEFHNQIITIGSELDTFFKEFCGYNLNDYKSITDYADKLLNQNAYSNIVSEKIRICNEYNLNIMPFDGWNSSSAKQSLPFWQTYDNLKHGRKLNMKEANLENSVKILGALFLLEMKSFYDMEDGFPDVPDVESELFKLDWNFKWKSMNNAFMCDE